MTLALLIIFGLIASFMLFIYCLAIYVIYQIDKSLRESKSPKPKKKRIPRTRLFLRQLAQHCNPNPKH